MKVKVRFWCHYKKNDWSFSLLPTIDLDRLKGDAITCSLNRFSVSFYWLFWSVQINFNKDVEKKYENKDKKQLQTQQGNPSNITDVDGGHCLLMQE